MYLFVFHLHIALSADVWPSSASGKAYPVQLTTGYFPLNHLLCGVVWATVAQLDNFQPGFNFMQFHVDQQTVGK